MSDNGSERIVRALAAADPTRVDELVAGEWVCALCDAMSAAGDREHAADCPWRLAVEWVAGHPEP